MNENQTYMLQNREKHNIVNYLGSSNKEVKILSEEKLQVKKLMLKDYLRENKYERGIVDKILYEYLDDYLRDEIDKEIND